MNRKVIVLPLVVGLSLATLPLLSACNPAQIVQDAAGNAIKNAVKDATGVDVATGSLPDGWPASVPVVSGEVQQGGSVDLGNGSSFEASIKVSDVATATAEAKSQMAGAGFTADTEMDLDGSFMGSYSNAEYNVTITIGKTGNDSTAAYVVMPVSGG